MAGAEGSTGAGEHRRAYLVKACALQSSAKRIDQGWSHRVEPMRAVQRYQRDFIDKVVDDGLCVRHARRIRNR
jgi:hypothetical protein